MQSQYTAPEDHFWSLVQKSDDCWWWQGPIVQSSRRLTYGHFKFRGKQLLAHQFSYELHVGEIPSGFLVMHECDQPTCVNPAHLRLGTHRENHRDKARKGRVVTGWESHRKELLGLLDHRERIGGTFAPTPLVTRTKAIRLFVEIGLSQAAVARRLSISQNMVSKILKQEGVRIPVMWKNMRAAERVELIRAFNSERAW